MTHVQVRSPCASKRLTNRHASGIGLCIDQPETHQNLTTGSDAFGIDRSIRRMAMHDTGERVSREPFRIDLVFPERSALNRSRRALCIHRRGPVPMNRSLRSFTVRGRLRTSSLPPVTPEMARSPDYVKRGIDVEYPPTDK